jgi:dipeptidyl aminopeptidase/acylaminoacyl peptidase
MKKHLLFIISLFVLNISFSQSGNELIKVTDMLKIKTVGNVTLSKDGSKAAFTLTSIEPDDTRTDYKYISQVYMVFTDGTSASKQLTSSKDGSSQPAWSPDGKLLAFVRAVDNKPQIFILPMDGGEAKQFTRHKNGASNPKWSPDGKQILFSSSITLSDLLKDSISNPSKSIPFWSMERPGFTKNEFLKTSSAKPNPDGSMEEIRAYLLKDEIDKKATVLTKLNFQDEANVSGETNFIQFFITDAKDSAHGKLISSGFNRFNNADFHPDGKKLIFSGSADSLENPDRVLESQVLMSNLDGSNVQLLLGKPNVSYNTAKVSPSGKWLAFQFSATGVVEIPQLAIMQMNSSTKEIIIIPFDRSKSNLTWSQDEKYLYFLSQSNGGQPLHRVNLDSKKIDQFSDFNSGVVSYDITGNKIVFAKTQVSNPSELYIADASMKNIKQVSNFNKWVTEKKLSIPEKQSFINDKGMAVEYWVMKPANYSPGKKYPLLLEIHGGPASMWGPGEASM